MLAILSYEGRECKAMLMEKTWYHLLKKEFSKEYMKILFQRLNEEYSSGYTIYPSKENIFAALEHTPYDKVKIVIIGQDPYHNPHQAQGLSFSVPDGMRLPPSLRNIFLEIKNDLNIDNFDKASLLPWARQGVLLLNTTLTVRRNSPKSHYGWGWEIFTDTIIERLNQSNSRIIFMLWGRIAQEKVPLIDEKHYILKAAHPSPFSAKHFLGCKHFSKANELLTSWNKSPINWQL